MNDHAELIAGLLTCQLTGADREFLERIERDGFSDEERYSRCVSEDDERMWRVERQRVEMLALSFGVTA